jgi:septal ring factor EnvC (AmiA/AmiB activator)
MLIFSSVFFINQPDCSAGKSEKKFLEIQDKLKSKLDALKETSKKEKSVTEKLEDINKNIKKKENELKHYSKQISQTQSEIQSLSNQINVISGKLENNTQYLEEVILAFYKKQYDSNALILLSAHDYQDLIKKMKYASMIAHYDGNIIKQYSDEINRINEKKKKLETLQKNLDGAVRNAKDKKSELYKEGQKKDRMLASLKARRNEYEKNITELEDSSQKVQNMLKIIKSDELPKSIVGNGFKSLKGQLPWPVHGEAMVPYGKNKKLRSNTSVLKSGIEIKAKAKDTPKVVAGGRVVFADKFKGYGKLVIIDHGSGYHSLYGNLSEVSLEKGNIVITGFKVGTILTSKTLNVPTLYFEIRHKGRSVDPLEWLESRVRIK